MPTAPPTRCHCGHPATRRGRCDQHQPKPWERPSIRNQKLNRWQWQKTAEDFLRHHVDTTTPALSEVVRSPHNG